MAGGNAKGSLGHRRLAIQASRWDAIHGPCRLAVAGGNAKGSLGHRRLAIQASRWGAIEAIQWGANRGLPQLLVQRARPGSNPRPGFFIACSIDRPAQRVMEAEGSANA